MLACVLLQLCLCDRVSKVTESLFCFVLKQHLLQIRSKATQSNMCCFSSTWLAPSHFHTSTLPHFHTSTLQTGCLVHTCMTAGKKQGEGGHWSLQRQKQTHLVHTSMTAGKKTSGSRRMWPQHMWLLQKKRQNEENTNDNFFQDSRPSRLRGGTRYPVPPLTDG